MSTASSRGRIKQLLDELRSRPDPGRHAKICARLECEYHQALMPWVDVENQFAKYEDRIESLEARLRSLGVRV